MKKYKSRELLFQLELKKSPAGKIPIIKIFHKVWLDDTECIQIMKYNKENNNCWYPVQYLQIPIGELNNFFQLIDNLHQYTQPCRDVC